MIILSGLVVCIVLLEGGHVYGRYVDPQVMTLSEAEQYLDGAAVKGDHVYEIVSPWELDNKRRRRDADSLFDVAEFKFAAFGEDFHLQLTPNRFLTREGLQVKYVAADGDVEERPLAAEHKDCYKFGRLLSHDEVNSVAVSTCNDGLSGVIKLEGYDLYIQKLTDNHAESVRRKRRDLDNPHIVYRRSASDNETYDESDDGASEHFCSLKTFFDLVHTKEEMVLPAEGDDEDIAGDHDFMDDLDEDDATTRQRRHKRAAGCRDGSPIGVQTLELAVVVDYEMNQYYSTRGRSVTDYTLTFMNTVASSFLHESLGNPLAITIVQLIVLQSPNTLYDGGVLSVNENGSATLDSFCQYQQAINVGDDADPRHHDNAMLLTRNNLESDGNKNLLGIAYFHGTCNPSGCALIEETGFGSVGVAVHELGHNLGMEHDGGGRFSNLAANCQDGINIMSSSRTRGSDSFIWSTCSKEQFEAFLCDSRFPSCLSDSPTANPFPLNPDSMPGVEHTSDEQCRIISDEFVGVCEQHVDVCGHLACLSVNGRCKGTGVPALDGTTCSDNMWCAKGVCVEDGSGSTTPISGWSTWSSFSQCTLSCGSGIRFRSRQCNKYLCENIIQVS